MNAGSNCEQLIGVSEMEFVPAVEEPAENQKKSYWFCFQNNQLMVQKTDQIIAIPLMQSLKDIAVEPVRTQYLGKLDGIACFSGELPSNTPWHEDAIFLNLIELFNQVEEAIYKVAVYAHQVMAWDREHQFCGVCGAKTENLQDERAKKCSQCGHTCFPRISPAIMVAILKEGKILLAKNKMFRQGFYSVLAGFLEPGEQLEECVMREVKEEVGLYIKNLRYFGSQPWPFPNSLMIAFIADYAGGNIAVDGKEIVDADWFSADELPNCPSGNLSVAGRLIDWFRRENA